MLDLHNGQKLGLVGRNRPLILLMQANLLTFPATFRCWIDRYQAMPTREGALAVARCTNALSLDLTKSRREYRHPLP
jgi:hypothetical protein